MLEQFDDQNRGTATDSLEAEVSAACWDSLGTSCEPPTAASRRDDLAKKMLSGFELDGDMTEAAPVREPKIFNLSDLIPVAASDRGGQPVMRNPGAANVHNAPGDNTTNATIDVMMPGGSPVTAPEQFPEFPEDSRTLRAQAVPTFNAEVGDKTPKPFSEKGCRDDIATKDGGLLRPHTDGSVDIKLPDGTKLHLGTDHKLTKVDDKGNAEIVKMTKSELTPHGTIGMQQYENGVRIDRYNCGEPIIGIDVTTPSGQRTSVLDIPPNIRSSASSPLRKS